MKRRDFFKLTALASGAVVSACNSKLDEKILPYLVPPEDGIIPGESSFVRSTCSSCPANCGIEIKVSDGKAVKLEGNPSHPVNRGGMCLRGQASLASLYHPDRLTTPLIRNSEGNYDPSDWETVGKIIQEKLKESTYKDLNNIFVSRGLSGSLKKLTAEFCKKMNFFYPGSIETIDYNSQKEANRIVFNNKKIPRFGIGESDVILTIGADILDTFISPVEFSKLISEGRGKDLRKWYHIGEVPSLTGYSADDNSSINSGSAHHLLSYLVKNIRGKNRIPGNIMDLLPALTTEKVSELTGLSIKLINEISNSLSGSKSGVVITGGTATSGPEGILTATLSSLLQWKMGAPDHLIDFKQGYDLGSLTDHEAFTGTMNEFRDGSIGVILSMDLTAWPFDYELTEKLASADFKIAISEFMPSEKGMFDIILPKSDNLESWGDTFSGSGTRSLIQPGIEPEYETKSPGEILLWMSGEKRSWQNYLNNEWGGTDEKWIGNGFRIEDSADIVNLLNNSMTIEIALKNMLSKNYTGSYEDNTLFFTPAIRSYDGRDDKIHLLSEVPDPLTTITYGDFITISEKDSADKLIKDGDIIKIQGENITGEYPAVISRTLGKGKLVLPLNLLENTADQISGENGSLKTVFQNISISKTGKAGKLPRLSGSYEIEGRDVLPFLNEGDGHHHHKLEKLHTLYPEHEHIDYRWGMVIDLDACTGCSSCVASCYIENNIPMTGEAEHMRGREMSWLRIEPYISAQGEAEFLPMMCQQCDHAPCETVCPVYATYHNQEGLNAQVYNRCVGTRYCANNCPYKARRFNWFDNEKKLPLYETSNPDLSVRPKGVMEKCTFCIQRIRTAKDLAKDEGRLAGDGEVKPACAQSCPSDAIAFGNLLDENSMVSRLVRENKTYRVHESLGTRPAVYYIKRKKGKALEHFENKLENDKK